MTLKALASGESKSSLENGQTNFVVDYETDEDIEKAEMDFLNRRFPSL